MADKASRPTFILYKSMWDSISDLDDKYLGQLFRAIFRYQIDGIEPENHSIIYRDFRHFKPHFDRDDVKYQGIVDKKRLAGAEGGKQKAANLADASTSYKTKHNLANVAPNDNVNDNDIIIPPTPLNGVSEETPKKPRARKPKVTKTRRECEEFYESQMATIPLEENFPADLLEAARTRRIPYPAFELQYRQLWSYMSQPSTMWPNGMWGHVLARENQLTYLQYCELVLVAGMGSADIKEYLNQWENKRYDNSNIYATLQKWWRDRDKSKSVNGSQSEPAKKGLSLPREVRQ